MIGMASTCMRGGCLPASVCAFFLGGGAVGAVGGGIAIQGKSIAVCTVHITW